MSSSRIRLDKLDPNDPLALKIKAALNADPAAVKACSEAAADYTRQLLGGPVVVKSKTFLSGLQSFDSTEEYEFQEWCHEAGRLGLVMEATYHPPAFKLSPRQTITKYVPLKTKQKVVDAFLFHPHEYTADFQLTLTDKGKKFLNDRDLLHTPYIERMYIDVKGGFSLYHDDKPFSINQKWVFDKFKVYIYKVVPKKWFARTWVPRAARYSPKKGKLRDCYAKCETYETIKGKLDEKSTDSAKV